jgi:hypothetical protein
LGDGAGRIDGESRFHRASARRAADNLEGTVRRALTLVALADAAPVFDGAD